MPYGSAKSGGIFSDIIRRYGVAGAAPMLGMTVAQLQGEMDAQGVTE